MLPLFLKGGADVIFRFCFLVCAAPPSPPGSRYLEDFEEIEKIGTGSFSEVFKARNRVDGWLYAVKQAKRAFSSPADMHNTLKEVYALAALGSHPHVVRYYSAWVEDRLYIQTGKRNATQRNTLRRLMIVMGRLTLSF